MTESRKKMLAEIQYPDLQGTKEEVEIAEKIRKAFVDYYMKMIDSHKPENHLDNPKTYASRCKREKREAEEMKATIEIFDEAMLWNRCIGARHFIEHYSWDTVAQDTINWKFRDLGDHVADYVEEGMSKEKIVKELRAIGLLR